MPPNARSLAWRVAALLACTASLNYADRTSLSAVFPLLQRDLGLNDQQLGLLGSFFLWSYAAGSPLAGYFADRLPRGRVVAGSLLAWSLVTIWSGLARTGTELMFSRVLLGVAECGYLPAAVALLADHHPPATRGRAMAVHLCGLNAGLVGGGTLAGYLGETHGWRASLLVLGVAGALLAALCWWLLEEGPVRRRETAGVAARPLGAQLRRFAGHSPYLLLAAQAMLVSVGTWMFFNWMPLYFRESFGLSLALAGFSGTAVLQLSAVAGAVTGGFVSDAAVRRRGIPGRLLAMTVCYMLCAPCLLVFLVAGGGMLLVASAVVVFSLLRSLAAANETPSMCDLVAAEDRSTAQALMNAANTTAGGLGVFLAGALKADWGLGGVFAGVSGVMLIAAGLTLVAMKRAAAMPRKAVLAAMRS